MRRRGPCMIVLQVASMMQLSARAGSAVGGASARALTFACTASWTRLMHPRILAPLVHSRRVIGASFRLRSVASKVGDDTEDPLAKIAGVTGGHPNKKVRLDELLVAEGLAVDAKEAAALCMANKVLADNKPITSSAVKVSRLSVLRLRGQKEHPWVSRGGMKMAHALEQFPINVTGAIVVDVGCSTGGFTEVVLKKGAAKVYAVDVGYGQLALPLRNDERVVVLERTNARNLTKAEIPDTPNLVVCDASFIPMRKVLPATMALCGPGANLVALIKPQFEAQHHEVESGTGVVRDEAVRARICGEVQAWLAEEGWDPQGLTTSPIKGPAGNVEFIVHAVNRRAG